MPKKIPQRMCVACRIMRPKRELIRLVANQNGDISLDSTGRKPGRGAYVCRSRHCLEQAVRGRKLDKGLKARTNESVIAALTAEMAALPLEVENQGEDGACGDEET
jgi:predicted RNA-binding protein YlxR (DUF448 family)